MAQSKGLSFSILWFFLEFAKWFFPKVPWFFCGVQFLGICNTKLGPQPAHVDLFTQLSSNDYCSTSNTAQVQHMLSLISCSGQEWLLRESVVGLIKNAFFIVANCPGISGAVPDFLPMFRKGPEKLL